MSFYSLFYWITVADSVKGFFDTSSNLFTTITVVCSIAYLITHIGKSISVSENKTKNEESDKIDPSVRSWEMIRKYTTRLLYPMLALAIITWAGYVFTPTKKDCLLIVAGGAVGNFMVTDTSAKQLPSDITKFLHMSLKKEVEELSDDAKRELGVQSPKDKLIDKAKEMTKEQLIEFIKSDTSLIK